MVEQLFFLFSLHNEAVFAFKDDEIIYYNGAAEVLLPDIRKLKPRDVFPPEILAGDAERFFGEADIKGRLLSFACAMLDGFRIVCLQRQEGDAASQETAMFSAMSLEMKDYLNVLRTASGVVLPYVEDTANARLGRYAAMINKSYFNMLRLAENMELLASGKKEPGLTRIRFDLVTECAEIITACAELTYDTGINLSFHSDLERLDLYADRNKLRQLVLNLISNSLLHTPSGGQISLHVKKTGNSASIQVSDTGSGISGKAIQSAWNRYGEAKSMTDTKSGAGFGISAVSKIARLHGGGVFFESQENKGTRFTVIIPIECGEATGFSSAITDYDSGVSPFLTGLSTVLGFEKYMQKYMD